MFLEDEIVDREYADDIELSLVDSEILEIFLFLKDNLLDRFPILGVKGRNNFGVSKKVPILLGEEVEILELVFGTNSFPKFSNRLADAFLLLNFVPIELSIFSSSE